MISKLLAICLSSVSAAKYDTKVSEGISFTQWVSLMVSRGVYMFLLGLIVICVIISAIRNRKQNRRLQEEMMKTRKSVLADMSENQGWMTNLWKGPQMFALQGDSNMFNKYRKPSTMGTASDTEVDYDIETLKEKLREAEVSVTALKEELDIANKARLELENSMENIEKDRSVSGEELRKTKLSASLNLEEMKKEINNLQRQLNQAQSEKTYLTKELEAVARENRIADSALKDQQNLSTRLDEAKSEISRLKEMMSIIRSERDEAVTVASELVAKARGAAKECVESRKLIRDILEGSSKDLTFATDDAVGDGPNQKVPRWNLLDEDEADISRSSEGIEVEATPSSQTDLDQQTPKRLVTNSPEFRQFLRSAFRPNDDEEY